MMLINSSNLYKNIFLMLNIKLWWSISFGAINRELYEGSRCNLATGDKGICKRSDQCQWAIDGVLNEGTTFYTKIQEAHCAWNTIEIICCPPNEEESELQTKSRLSLRKSEIACNRYKRIMSKRLTFHVLGGTPTDLGEFPHMVALGYRSEELNTGLDFNCGGTLISRRYILTAAHCVTGRTIPIVIRTGTVKIVNDPLDDDPNPIDKEIKNIIVHPLYKNSRKYNDIAIIEIDPIEALNDFVKPACLYTELNDIDPNIELIVTGWGLTSVEKNQKSNVLLKANLTSVPLDRCNSSILNYNSRNPSIPMGILDGQLCAYDPEGKKDSCQGDSGGPIQIVHVDEPSTVVGVTSFGISCGTTLPSIFTRIAYYLDWIESIVWTDND